MSRDLLQRIEKAFAKALERARDAGELSDDANTRALARFLVTTFQGLDVVTTSNVQEPERDPCRHSSRVPFS